MLQLYTDAIEPIVIGILAAVTVIYTFQTRIAYPVWLLRAFDYPWVLLVALVIVLLMYPTLPKISVMLCLLVLAMWMDFVLFSKDWQLDTQAGGGSKGNGVSSNVYGSPLERKNDSEYEKTTFGSMQPIYPVFAGTQADIPGPAPVSASF